MTRYVKVGNYAVGLCKNTIYHQKQGRGSQEGHGGLLPFQILVELVAKHVPSNYLLYYKVEKNYENILDSIPLPSVKIQIIGGKFT